MSLLVVGALTGGCTTPEPTVTATDPTFHEQMAIDSQYMTKLFATTEDGMKGSGRVDLADPVQYRFVMNRLAAAGKTAVNSPHLFESLEQTKVKAIAQAKAGTSASVTGTDFCAGLILMGSEVQSGTSIIFKNTHPTVSCLGGAAYVYADITTYNSNRAGTENFVVASAAGEDYTGGTAFDAVRTDPALPAVLGRVNRTDSLIIADDAFGNEQITFNVVQSDVVPFAGSLLLQHPVLHGIVANGGSLEMCQLRGAENQCDYRIGNLPNAAAAFAPFAAPINGVAAVRSVNPWVGETAQFFPFPAPFNSGHIYLPTVGIVDAGAVSTGNCAIKTISSATFHLFKAVTGGVCDTSTDFASQVVLTANPRKATFQTVSDFTNNGGTGSPAGVNCSLASIVNETVKPALVINAMADCGAKNSDGSVLLSRRVITLSPDGTSPLPFLVKFLNSCFAEGTSIRRAGGATAAVEKIKVGDKVVADAKGTVLTVTGISRGIEDEPLVDLRDNKGHKLHVTTKHPILKASGEVVFASTIKTGDQVMTDRGIASIVSVARLPYTGQVYNLKLGTPEEQLKVGKNGTTMFAGGFLVGDSAMQQDHSTPRLPVAQLSKAWERDFQNAAANNPPMKRLMR
jgi:hypothetical protein